MPGPASRIEVTLSVELPIVWAFALAQLCREVARSDLAELSAAYALDPIEARAWMEAAGLVHHQLAAEGIRPR